MTETKVRQGRRKNAPVNSHSYRPVPQDGVKWRQVIGKNSPGTVDVPAPTPQSQYFLSDSDPGCEGAGRRRWPGRASISLPLGGRFARDPGCVRPPTSDGQPGKGQQ